MSEESTKTTGTIVKTTEKVIENVKEVASDIAEGVEGAKETAKEVVEKAKAVIDKNVEVLEDVVKEVKTKVDLAKTAVVDTVAKAVAKAEDIVDMAQNKTETLEVEVEEKVSNAVEVVTEKAADVVDTTKGVIEEVKDNVRDIVDAAKGVIEEVKNTAADVVEVVKDDAEDAVDTTKGVIEAIKEKVADVIEEVKDTAADVIEEVKEKAESIAGEIDEKTKTVTAEAKIKISEVVDAVKQKATEVREGAKDVVEDLKGAVEVVVAGFSKDEKPSKQKAVLLNDEYLADLSSKTLKEIVQIFQELIDRGDQHEMYKYTESIKTSFYKALKREKIAIGFISADEEKEVDTEVSSNPFAQVERGFKELYSQYKASRAVYVREMERKKEENLKIKLQIIEELKLLLEKQEDINKTFLEFRVLQNRWRDSGAVPQAKVKDIYDTYQHYVEMFYDYVKINNEFRDLDFKKNLEAKIALCGQAEALLAEDNVIDAFSRLQKLHEDWKEFGPVEKEHREEIWDRFKLATSQINKKHHTHFEGVKDVQKDNLAAKAVLCEKAEEVSVKEIPDSNSWNVASKELTNLQQEWKTIGFASKKDNQKIYDRFRAACDKFYDRKREYYAVFKDQMSQNIDKKVLLCEQAEALKDSTDWGKTTDKFIHLQKAWKETGPVSRKKSEQIWSRFRAACDHFFDNKEKNFGGANADQVENLEKKLAIIEEIKSYTLSSDQPTNVNIMRGFITKWSEIGFVPFKEKEKIQGLFKSAMEVNFPDYKSSGNDRGGARRNYGNQGRGGARVFSERDKLIQEFRKKESEISTFENNIGFFASSKNASTFIQEFEKKIETAKQELADLENKIKSIDKQSE